MCEKPVNAHRMRNTGTPVTVHGAYYRQGRLMLRVLFPSGRMRTWDAANVYSYPNDLGMRRANGRNVSGYAGSVRLPLMGSEAPETA